MYVEIYLRLTNYKQTTTCYYQVHDPYDVSFDKDVMFVVWTETIFLMAVPVLVGLIIASYYGFVKTPTPLLRTGYEPIL
jgi:hypothetical protein